ncbi:MAG: putative surface protein precursor [bacterium ADurb.Bin212]|nr:MAG: putative surface protein precursor [bacterium ADurb.Bin212]
MFFIFFLLLLLSVIALMIGLASPKTLNKIIKRDFFNSRKLVAKYLGIASIVLLIAATTSASTLPEPEKKESKPAQTEQKTTPKMETKEDIKTEEVTFETKNQDDPTLEKGQTKTKQEGQNGVKKIYYKVTLQDGKETGREKTSETVVSQPVDKIVLVGTKEKVATTPTSPSTQPTTSSNTTQTNSTPTSSYTCGTKKTCSQMTTCSEARYFLDTCGVSSLDRDKDGVPCEDICG